MCLSELLLMLQSVVCTSCLLSLYEICFTSYKSHVVSNASFRLCKTKSTHILLLTEDVSRWRRKHGQSSPWGLLPWPLSITAWEKHLTGSLREHSWLFPSGETNACKQNKWEMCVFVTDCKCVTQSMGQTQDQRQKQVI